MTMTRATGTGEDPAPPLGELLLRTAATARELAAVGALAEEEHLLARDNVRAALVVKTGGGTMGCSWERFGSRLYTLGLDDAERAFAGLVLSLAGPHQTSLTRVLDLDERRLAILLRAMVSLSGCDTIAVGTRM
jgi:hypothetical protein